MLREHVSMAVAAQGGDSWAAVANLDVMLAAEPKSASLSAEQKDLRRALGVL